MTDHNQKQFQNSLDITSDALEQHVPELLKGLWELGSITDYIVELVKRNISTDRSLVLDLGCGKGAVLIELAKHFDIRAVGVDIVPDFIQEAIQFSKDHKVSDKIQFKTEDLFETISTTSNQDIVIYGYDSEILGDLNSTLGKLKKTIKKNGFIVLEFMFSKKPINDDITDKQMISIIEKVGFTIFDRIDWDTDTLKNVNERNTNIIKENVRMLSIQHPDKKKLFEDYLQNQIDECIALENDYTCTTLLLKQLF